MSQRSGAAMRLDRLLALQGLCTRSQAKQFLLLHRVLVDGQLPRSQALRVSPKAVVSGLPPHPFPTLVVDGEELRRRPLHLLVHKPIGYVCSRRREQSAPVALDLLPESWSRLRFAVL